ncbi:MAG: C_GCAxxG_C_C family protein [Mogibacterium sp.]|nr:C_GCAxxG_C_C family protein [Mogibacterium sp.]
MSDRADIATAKHRNGFNCCQSVACTFADAVGVDESLIYKMGEGFGAGMGTAQGVCGALSGAAMIAGLVYSDGNIEMGGQTKAKTTRAAGIMQKKFVERAKALICKDIKTGNNGSAYTSCNDCIRIAVELVEEELGL